MPFGLGLRDWFKTHPRCRPKSPTACRLRSTGGDHAFDAEGDPMAVTTLEYALIANAVYDIGRKGGNWTVPGFEATLFEEGMSWGATKTDFKGCTYYREATQDAVVALQGTDLSKVGDLVADGAIGVAIVPILGLLPQYCGAALRLYRKTQEAYGSCKIALTGHSLGGALAQVIGHWTGKPFVTFNAPGMWGDIQKSKVFRIPGVQPPEWKSASIAGTFKGSLWAKQMATTGRNFRNYFDVISFYGMHYGPVTRLLLNPFFPWSHFMAPMVEKIDKSTRWRDANPLDPANKEWGEL
jgi:hypothetical protein